MGYEVFTQKGKFGEVPREARIRINRNGVIEFNKPASRILATEGVGRVLLMWDEKGRKIGFRPAGQEDERAYPVRVRKWKQAAVTAKAFLDHIAIGLTPPCSFAVAWVDGVLEAQM